MTIYELVIFAVGVAGGFAPLIAETFASSRRVVPTRPAATCADPALLPNRPIGYRANVRPEARLARRATRWKRFKWSLRIGPVRLWWRGTKRWWRRRARTAPVQLSAADRAQGEIERRAALRTYEKHRQAHDAAVRAWRDEVTCWCVLPCATCGAATEPCDAGLHS